MIELLLAADAALERDELDLAERLFTQVAEADARNAMALVGVARVAMRRGRDADARAALGRALEIDPQEAAARRLLADLDAAKPATGPAPGPAPQPAASQAAPAPARRPSLLDRIRRRLGLGGRR